MSVSAFTWTDRAYPVVEVGIGDSRTAVGQVWDTGRWDTAEWSGLEPEWIDISCNTNSASFTYGRQAISDRFIVGTATITVDNATGWADPNTLDPEGELTLRPGRQIRVSVQHQEFGRRVLFRGYIDAMTPVYDPVEHDRVELSCIDALGEVNRAKLTGTTTPGVEGESTSGRVNRILDAIDWTPRDIALENTMLIAADMTGQVADLLGITADSAGGVVFGDMAGRVAFRGNQWLIHEPGTPVDGTIGNGSDVAAEVCPVQWERPFARADITTRAIVGRDLATAATVDDPAGIAKYGIEPFERTDLHTLWDSMCQALARRALVTRGDATAPRVRSVTLDARTADNALDLMATVDVYKPSRYRCRLQLDRGIVFDDEYFATGVTHDITPTSWTMQLNLDVAAPFKIAGGRWDGAHWDTDQWTAEPTARELIGASP